jgi:protein gp37
MAEQTKIQWADATFNPVIGCMKVSAGCDNCYAENMMDTRMGRVKWGQRNTEATTASVGTRIRTSEGYWQGPLRWARQARKTGVRKRVFCASLSDVFDNQWLMKDRSDLFDLIESTPEIDWLLLTKRPENINKLSPFSWMSKIPRNIWLGTTAENQETFDRRWPILRKFSSVVRFISYEPAIGPLSMALHNEKPDWLICGGESGQGHRDMNPAWAYRIMDECKAASVPFFMKQMSGTKKDGKIPDDLMIRQFPIPTDPLIRKVII